MRFTLIGTVLIFFWLGVIFVMGLLLFRMLFKYLKGEPSRKKTAASRSLGEALKDHRTRRNMTQEYVAEALGVSRQAVSKWENGTSDPSTSNLLALARLYGVSAGELLEH